jgi:hypothetical protein
MISLTQLRDQIELDANIKGNPDFGVIRLNRIINLAQRYVQAQLNGLGHKKWETAIPITPIAGTFSGKNIKKIGVNNLTNMLESPRSIIFIEVTDGTLFGVAFPTDANKFKSKVVNTYDQASMLDPVFTRLANLILLTPSAITSGTVYYYKCINDLSDSTLTITGATAGSGIVTVTVVNHGLTDGDSISIAGALGMTDLNSTFQVMALTSNTFSVPLSTSQSWSSGGVITTYSQIPVEFEDFIVRKAVMDIGINQGKIQNKENAMTEFNNDLTNVFNKFYGTVQSESINNDVQNKKMQ